MRTIAFSLHAFMLATLGALAEGTTATNQPEVSKAQRIGELESRIKKLSSELRDLRKEDREVSGNYKFTTVDGEVTLGDLFQGKKDLIVIHNMGKDCPYCTSYADGLNGVLKHLEDRTAVVLLSPNKVADQTQFAKSRGWGFKMVSTDGCGEKFNTDMGFYKPKEGVWPGFSVFHKEGEKVTRVSFSSFEPGDEYCVLFPYILMLKDGANGWYPKFEYKGSTSGQ